MKKGRATFEIESRTKRNRKFLAHVFPHFALAVSISYELSLAHWIVFRPLRPGRSDYIGFTTLKLKADLKLSPFFFRAEIKAKSMVHTRFSVFFVGVMIDFVDSLCPF